jgi:hypothetical protein
VVAASVDQLVAGGEPVSITLELADLIMQVTTVRPRADEMVLPPRVPAPSYPRRREVTPISGRDESRGRSR